MRLRGLISTMAVFSAAMFTQAELIGEWTFDEGSGTDVANTASTGTNYNGTVNGTASFVTGHDGTGYAINIGGTAGNGVTINSPDFLDSVSNQITIAFWAYGDTNIMPMNTVAFAGPIGGDRHIQSHLPWGTSGGGTIYWDCADRVSFGGDADLIKGVWTYWVMTKNTDEETMKVYANGLQVASATKSGVINGSNITAFVIGNNAGLDTPYGGIIDEFKVYNHELSYEEIAIGYDPNIIAPVLDQDGSVGSTPFEVTFTATNSIVGQGVSEYLWNFGENTNDLTAVDAIGGVVSHTFVDIGTYTVTLYVVDNAGVTGSVSTTVGVVEAPEGTSDVLDLMVDEATSSTAYYGTSVEALLTDTFGYFPYDITTDTPSLDYADGFHGNESDGGDVWLSFLLDGSNSYTTVEANPVVIMDVWGRNYSGAKNRDDDFDVELYNGSWDAADMVGSVNGSGVDDSSNYVRVTFDTLPVGTTFDRVRIVGHNSRDTTNNAFTLTEIRLAAIVGDIVTVKAIVSADVESGYYPLDVVFDGSASYAVEGSITDYLWDFGDGNSASGSDTAAHTYSAVGVFTSTLSVVNSLGETNSAEVVITATNPINVGITASNETAVAGVNIYFDASSTTNYITNAVLTVYSWDFGDGESATGMNVVHAYDTAGTNTVTLTVQDDQGRSNTGTVTVYILPAHELTLDGTTLSWDSEDGVLYEVQYNASGLGIDDWTTYTNVTGAASETSVELPLGRDNIEFYRVLMH